ncbi:MAG: RnfABCDGE type electron transport complex subunit D [Oscillospiraceae bacterium]|jgi:electron transport complex protein RnfD|nr:RnfABCDGE type electron transport complex subunit D [Oscillospiraceae bacterium]
MSEPEKETPQVMVSTSPHIRSGRTTRGIMMDVCLALMPALAASLWHFGVRALALTALSVTACVLLEFLSRKIMKRPQTVGDWSAVVTGILLAFNLPVTLPFWIVPIGAAVAIVVVKQMFGGIGQNFVNPAITARIVLTVSFAGEMTKWAQPSGAKLFWASDAIATATPMAALAAGKLPKEGLIEMLIGSRSGSLGETCALALLLGAVYLCLFRVIRPLIPAVYIGTVALFAFVAGGFNGQLVLYELLGGGLILGACFMATDYSTCPIHWKGKLVFALGCGLLTGLIRFYGNMPEGVSFSILLMNLLVPLIENITAPKAFGKERKRHAKA